MPAELWCTDNSRRHSRTVKFPGDKYRSRAGNVRRLDGWMRWISAKEADPPSPSSLWRDETNLGEDSSQSLDISLNMLDFTVAMGVIDL